MDATVDFDSIDALLKAAEMLERKLSAVKPLIMKDDADPLCQTNSVSGPVSGLLDPQACLNALMSFNILACSQNKTTSGLNNGIIAEYSSINSPLASANSETAQVLKDGFEIPESIHFGDNLDYSVRECGIRFSSNSTPNLHIDLRHSCLLSALQTNQPSASFSVDQSQVFTAASGRPVCFSEEPETLSSPSEIDEVCLDSSSQDSFTIPHSTLIRSASLRASDESLQTTTHSSGETSGPNHSHCRLRTALLNSCIQLSSPHLVHMPDDRNDLVGNSQNRVSLPIGKVERSTRVGDFSDVSVNLPHTQSAPLYSSMETAPTSTCRSSVVASIAGSPVTIMAGGSSFSLCATTRPPSASHIQRSFSETLSCSMSTQVKSQSQPQSPEFRRGRASLPVSPCRLPMKKRKFDWGHLNETSDESNQSAAARSPIVRSCSASPSCPQKLLSRKFDSQFSASLSGYTQAPPVFEYQMSSPHDHNRQKPSAVNREVEMPLTLPSGCDYRPRGISVCPPQQAVTDDSDHILYTADQMKRRSGVQIPSLDNSNSQDCLTNTETNSEERTPIAKSAAKSRLSLLVRSLTPSSNAPRTSAERDRSPLTTHLHNYSEKPHALAQAQIAASSSLRSVPNLPVTSTLTCVDRSPTDPPSTEFDSCINKWRQEAQTFSLISTLSSALDTSQPTTMHSARDESRVHGTSVTNEDIILKFSPGHQSSASSVSDVAVHNHLHTIRDTKTPLFERISSPDTAVSQSLPNLHTPQMSTSDHIAHRDSTLDAAASVMGVTSGKQLSTPQQPETAKPLVPAASTAAGAERPSLDQSSASSSLHTALTTNANLHSNEFRDLRHKLPEDLPSNARILMVLSPTRHAANLSVTDVNRSHTVNSELNGSSFMRALNGSKSGFPLILVSASSSAGAAALAAAAALASGAPPTSLVPVPVQLTTYVPPTTRSAPHSFASPDAYPKETTDVPHRNQRLIISLCNPPISSTNECSQRQPHPRLHGESPLRESHLGAVHVDVAPPNVTVSPAVAMTHPRA